MKIRIFTDGSCSDNPGPGGWAAVFNTEDRCNTLQGHELSTTNNRMELTSVVKSLEKILKKRNHEGIEYELYSDSAYVVNAINNHWIEKWKENDWMTTKQSDVKNKDLWEKLYILREAIIDANISLKIIKVKGHSGNTFNEMVDMLAKEETAKAKEKLKAGEC